MPEKDRRFKENKRPEDREEISDQRPRLLVVEDDPKICKLVSMIVGLQGAFDGDYVSSVSDALGKLRKAKESGDPFQVILSDLGLKDEVGEDDAEGGLEIAGAVKREGLAGYFILFTGRASDFERMEKGELEKLGINRVIGKPAQVKVLENVLKEAKGIVSTHSA